MSNIPNINRFGLTEVYRPADETKHTVDIVLVHGLFGHPKDAWTCRIPAASPVTDAVYGNRSDELNTGYEEVPPKKLKKTSKELFREVFWPRDLLPSAIPQARVLTWGYDVDIAHAFFKTSKASIFQHAETLLNDLLSFRFSKSDKPKPLIFIAHSLGGIVVKDALSLSRIESTALSEILPATKGVIFLGTPHHGSDIASLGKIAAELSRILLQSPNVQVLRALEHNSEILERISRSFGQVLSSRMLNVHSFQEELETNGVKIVSASSSTIGYLHEGKSTLRANHRDMAKFSSHNDGNFQRVKSVLSRWIENIKHFEGVTRPASNLDLSPNELHDDLIFDEAYSDCLAGLNAYTQIRIGSVKPAYEDTYGWLFDRGIGVETWLAGVEVNPLYWIRGKPGSGKSTIMKYAMTSFRTRQLLNIYNPSNWIIAGFSFHNRGTDMQKSAEGFLSGILRQLLEQRKELFPLIYSNFTKSGKTFPTSETGVLNGPSHPWSLHHLREALSSIICSSKVPLNCCLFVDALDEHDGNHRDLISILMDWAQASEASLSFHLRLCLAGRPENVFKTAFRKCPGFAIQDYTTSDIRQYTEDRISKEHFGTLSDDDIKATTPLVEEIVRKADGVFLWVTLVVNELVEGLCEGDTIMELEQLLSEIPQELEDLYTRALRRIPRKSSSAIAKHKYEAYVMFQIALHTQDPWSLPQFMKMVFYSTFGERSVDDARAMSQDKLDRRLNSKSAGLLEAVILPEGEVNNSFGLACVQFIHQTTKEYISSSSGQSLLKDNLANKPLESGTTFILRYLISQITSEEPIERNLCRKSFGDYARDLEKREHIPVGRFLEPVITKSREAVYKILRSIIDFNFIYGYTTVTIPSRQEISFMVFYLLTNLSLSLRRSIIIHRDCIDEDVAYILCQSVSMAIDKLDSDTIQVLIEENVDAAIPDVDFHKLMDFSDLKRSGTDDATRRSRLRALRAQLQERRNKISIHIESESE